MYSQSFETPPLLTIWQLFVFFYFPNELFSNWPGASKNIWSSVNGVRKSWIKFSKEKLSDENVYDVPAEETNSVANMKNIDENRMRKIYPAAIVYFLFLLFNMAR